MISKRLAEVGPGHLRSKSYARKVLKKMELLKRLNVFITEVPSRQIEEKFANLEERSSRGILEGLPFTVKDNFCVDEMKTSCASRMLDNFQSPFTATVVQRMLDEGGILLGKTNLDEFAMGSGTVDSYVGPVFNIWGSSVNYDLMCPESGDIVGSGGGCVEADWVVAGGSSGGSAVSVAAGLARASLGSDTGGSVRIPSAWCGVPSIKPSYGLLSRHGLIPLVNSLDCPGIIGQTVEDCQNVLKATAGLDVNDSTSVDSEHLFSEEVKDVSRLKVGIPKEFLCEGMSPEVVEMWSRVADLFESEGANVSAVSLPHTELAIPCYSVLNPCEVASNMARYQGLQFGLRGPEGAVSTEDLYAQSRSQGFNEVVRGRILAGNYFLLKENYERFFLKALQVRRLIQEDYLKAWTQVDYLLTPVTLTDPPPYSSFVSKDNRSQTASQDFCTQPTNLAGVPSVTVPVSLSSRSLPLSVQLIAPIYRDIPLLGLAKWLESKFKFPHLVLKD